MAVGITSMVQVTWYLISILMVTGLVLTEYAISEFAFHWLLLFENDFLKNYN